MQFSPFQKPFPKAPCCLLVDAVALETFPSLLWKFWLSASWGLEGADICFLYQSFVLSVQILCRVETPLKGRGQAKQVPLPPTGGKLGFELSRERDGLVRGTEGTWPTPAQSPTEVLPSYLGVLGGITSLFYSLLSIPCPSSQGFRLGRGSLQSPQPRSGDGQPVMDSMRTSLRRPPPPVVLGSAPLSSVSPQSWLLPLPSILEGAPKR